MKNISKLFFALVLIAAPAFQYYTKRTLRLAIGCALAFSLAATSRGTTYDAHTDFSVTNGNPNGVWTYGYSTTLTSPLILYTSGFIDSSGNGTLQGNQVWDDPTHVSSGDPSVFNNPTNNQHGLLPANSAGFHPGSAGEFSHFLFTSPSTGLFSLSSLFTPLDSGGTDVHILENGVSIFSGNVSPNNSASFNTSLPLIAGSTLDFAVGFGDDGNFFNDSTGIAATVTSVDGRVHDGGMSVSLLGVGLTGIAFLRRKLAS